MAPIWSEVHCDTCPFYNWRPHVRRAVQILPEIWACTDPSAGQTIAPLELMPIQGIYYEPTLPDLAPEAIAVS